MRRDVSGSSRSYLKALFDEGVPSELTDGQLVERFASCRGEAAELAFEVLVGRHGPMVLRACRGILRDDHEAMDAFQATFLVLIKKGRSLWVRDSLGPWLHRVACRAAVRARAAARQRRELERRLAHATFGKVHGCDQDDLAAALHEELDRLPDRYRVPIVLCDLEGRTCEEAARHLGCPIGTIGSRLARGRERLRSRLARRGLAPAVATIVAKVSTESSGAEMPAALVKSTTQLGLGKAATSSGVVFSAVAVKLAEEISRRLLMVKLISIGAASTVVIAVSLATAWALRPSVGAQLASASGQVVSKKAAVTEPPDDFRFVNDRERMKNALYAEIGNMRPLIQTARGVAFQSRTAIRYHDGTAKLWSAAQKEPVAPPMRHKGPIKELTFFDASNLLITLSDESVKVWDALTGEPRKELEGQMISPMWLSFAPNVRRFVTIDSDHKVVTVWDAGTLAAVATLKTTSDEPVVESAGLSGDGRTVVMFRFRPSPSAELRDVASGQAFATLRLPSSTLAEVLAEGSQSLNRARLQQSVNERDTRFWEVVQSLAPKSGKRKD